MALSVVQGPLGHYINSTAITGIYTASSSIVTSNAHGLLNGDIVYIDANEAIGFWYVTKLSNNTFNIRDYSGATVYTFIGAGTFSYYTTYANDSYWNAVHLPIVYKLASTLWPTNSVDTARTVSSYANDNGYVKLTLSGAITSTVTELEFVKVTFTGGTSAIYQILTWYSNSVVTINLAYIGGITFTSVQYYYNNYHAKVRIYAGLATTHAYAAQKPYILVTEQKCVPDANGIITVNINEFLKQQIGIIKNDLLKGTLPNNLDAFCQFYISFAEAYDYSVGGYTLLDFVGSYTDGVGAYAINSDLPFKNVYSGYMSDYSVAGSFTGTSLQKFLTPSLYPALTPGQFFDISYIDKFGSGFPLRVKRECYKAGSIVNLVLDTQPANDIGVYRYAVTQSAFLEDRIDLTIQGNSAGTWYTVSETKTITIGGCNFNYLDFTWLNYLGGFDYWRFKSNSDYGVQIENTTQVRKNIFTNWPKSYGAGADTVRQETSRDSSQTIRVRAEYITMDQINDLFRIRTSPLVQIVNSRTDRRTILVDSDSFVYLQQSEKLFTLEFNCVLTDNLPSQSL